MNPPRCSRSPSALLMMTMMAMPLLLLLHLPATANAAATKCNGFSELCPRPFNEITFVSTHASFAVTNTSSTGKPGTQYQGIQKQLDDGVRGLHLNIFKGTTADEVVLCFPDCDVYNAGSLDTTLKIVKTWLDKHTSDVVTIFLDGVGTGASPAGVIKAFAATGLDTYALKGKPAKWPTLGSMIEQNTRLLVFTEDPAISDANTQKYFMPYADNVLKLDSAFSYGAEWTCAPYEFSTAYSLMLLPHYIQQTSLYNGKSYPNMPYPFNLGTTNGYQLEYHAIHCRGGKSLWVNYMQVDFYDKGDVFTPALKFNSLPFKGDDASNFVPKFYSGTAPVGGIMPLSSSATPVRSNTASMAIITSIMFAAWPLVARALRI